MPDRSTAAVRGFVLTGCVLLAAFVVTMLGQVLPGSVLPSGQRAMSRLIWPQGWGFFAEPDRREHLVAYTGSDPATDPQRITQRQSSISARWGLGRDSVLATYELSVLAEAIPAANWRSCGGRPMSACPGAATAPRQVLRAPISNPPLCGPAIIVFERPAPWGHSVREQPGVDRLARVDIRC